MKNTNDIARLYNLYVDDLSTYARYLGFEEETVMDAIHDVFCKLASDKNILNSVENVKFYLFKSLKNKLYDVYRINKKQVVSFTADLPQEMPFNITVTVEDTFIDVEERQLIKKQIEAMLNILTERQREIIYLRYIQEYDYQKISDLLNISVHGCRKLVSKAMLNLREKFGNPLVLLLFI